MPNPSLGRRCDKTFSFNFKAFFCGLSSYKYYFFSCSKKKRTSELIWKKSIEGRVFACLRNKRIVSGSPHPQDSLKHSLVIDREPGPGVRVWVAARANTHCRRHTSSRHCRQITEYSTAQYSYSTVQALSPLHQLRHCRQITEVRSEEAAGEEQQVSLHCSFSKSFPCNHSTIQTVNYILLY